VTRRTPIALLKKPAPTGRKGGQLANDNAVTSGVYGDLSRRNLDQRSKLARALREIEGELVSAIGGNPSPQQTILIHRIVYKLARITFFEASTLAGDKGADEHYLAWSNSLRLDLQAIGLDRVPPPTPTLADYLRNFDAAKRAKASEPSNPSSEPTKRVSGEMSQEKGAI
jgi:hypothetical protein